MPGAARAATIVDVAARAGVSRQTVSRAMNDQAGINAETRQRVLEAARDLHYRPSRFGRGMVKPGLPTLALLVYELANPFYPELASAIVDEAVAHGWHVGLVDIRHTQSGAVRLRDLGTQVDAIIGYVDPDDLRSGHLPASLPVVVLDAPPRAEQTGWAGIRLDPGPGMAELVHHLVVASGCRRPCVLNRGPQPALLERSSAFVDEMRRHGLETVVESTSSGEPHSSAAAVRRALERSPDIDAVFTFNDMHALAVVRELRVLGRSVPDDVAVAGVDGLAVASLTSPSLTSIVLDHGEIARHAMELTTGMFSGRLPMSGEPVHRTVGFRLRVGESTQRR